MLVTVLPLAAGPAAERALFKDLPAGNPVRQVFQAVLDLPLERVRRGFTDREWRSAGFDAAWRRARGYFPDRTYFVQPGTYFMTHGFDPDGRLFMEVHDSDYLALAIEAHGTFKPGAVLEAGGDAGGPRRAAIAEKLGRLEPFLRDEAAHRRLREALGGPLHRELLDELRRENVHMLAGGLIHEGAHAGLDDAVVARLQAEFRSGVRPVQWDELGAFMAEAAYHARHCGWAGDEVARAAGRIEASLRELEPLRRAPTLRSGRDRAMYEAGRARSLAFAALVRLRLRESWQSALRARSLVESFRRDYIRGDAPADAAGLLASLDRDSAAFVEALGRAVQAAELALRSLEATLDLWTEWAEGERPFPPPVTASRRAVATLREIGWPDPPAEAALALMGLAKAALASAPGS